MRAKVDANASKALGNFESSWVRVDSIDFLRSSKEAEFCDTEPYLSTSPDFDDIAIIDLGQLAAAPRGCRYVS